MGEGAYLVVHGQKPGFLTLFSPASSMVSSWPVSGLGLANLGYRKTDQWHSAYTAGSSHSGESKDLSRNDDVSF